LPTSIETALRFTNLLTYDTNFGPTFVFGIQVIILLDQIYIFLYFNHKINIYEKMQPNNTTIDGQQKIVLWSFVKESPIIFFTMLPYKNFIIRQNQDFILSYIKDKNIATNIAHDMHTETSF
jgi:hypothetical protein